MNKVLTSLPIPRNFVLPAWLLFEGAATAHDIEWLKKFDPSLPVDSAKRTKLEDIYRNALTFILTLPNAADVLREP